MTQNIIPFAFRGHEIRTALVEGEPAFVGKDICDRLGYANPNKAMNDHCKGVTKRYPLQTSGGLQEFRVLFEPDVLRLIIKSKLPEAEEFERWVFEEVLPAIRKTGGYMAAAPEETPEELALRAMSVLQATVERQKGQIADLSPKAAALDAISEAEGDVGVRDAGRELGVGQTKVSTYLIEHKWACREGRKMRPAHYGLSQKYVRLVQKTYPDRHTGETCVSDDFKITRRGLARLAILLCGTNSEPARRLNGMKEKSPVPFAKTPA
ncbi:phage antirepressor [Acetobacter cerevisiae]|uniref:Phage antitermination protein n=1 Tax=Acetobacter cerevisiae TaxID=178900 RepID=A0A149VF04_9PROT|nr:phage antirepressor [Acetobacter cerevisiae]KXV78781.1 phage antitermination protein [Acetobacter cerevisiae]